MPRKVIKKSKRQRGGAWYNDVWNWLTKAHSFVKDNKLISRIGTPIATALAPEALPVIGAAKAMGYGRRKRCVSCKVVRRRSRR